MIFNVFIVEIKLIFAIFEPEQDFFNFHPDPKNLD